MGVIRVKKTKNYTVMSNYHLKDKNLSLKAQGLLSIILSLPDDWDYSVAGLVAIVKDGKSAVQSALQELEFNDYIVRRRIKDDKGRILDWEYIIFENPAENNITESERKSINSPLTDFQDMGNTDVDNRDVEDMSQLNTKEPNTKEPNTNQKSTGAGASSKNHSQVYKQRNTLSDDLESGKNIDAQTKIKKKQSEEEKADRKIDKTSYSNKVKDLLKQFFRQSFYSKDVKRMKNASDLTGKLMRLDELVKKGEDPEKVVQQSIDKNWNAFYEYKQESTISRKGGELLNDNIVGTDLEDAKKRYQEAIDSEEEWF